MGISSIWILLLQLSSTIAHSYHEADFEDWYQPVARRPVDVVTDVVNDLGVRILQKYCDHGNVAFSPIGVSFVLAALYEGSAGRGSHQIGEALALPHDRDITRIGFRDIHRRLRTYLNADGFLGGLTLNRENTILRPQYEDILRFYGFDLSEEDEKNSNDTTPMVEVTTESTNAPTTQPEESTNPPITTIDVTLSPNIPITTTTTTTPEATELPVTSTIPPMTQTLGVTMDEGMVSDRLTQMSNITTTISSTGSTNGLATTNGNLETTSENATVSMQLPAVTMPMAIIMSTTVGQTVEATTIVPENVADTTTVAQNVPDTTIVAVNVPDTTTVQPNVPDTTTATMADSVTTINTDTTSSVAASNTTIPASTLPVSTMTTLATTLNMQEESSTNSTGQTEATTLPMDASSIEMNVTSTAPVSVTANAQSDLEVGPPAEESTVSTAQPITSGPNTMTGIENLESMTLTNEEGQGSTNVPSPSDDASRNRVRKRSTRSSRGYFSSYPDQGIWMQDLGIWKSYPVVTGEASVRDSTEISFLVNGCDVSSVMASRYVAVLPFAYFPSLHAVAVEFPLDDPRYNILLLMPTDRTDTHRLARDLGGKSLRWLRKQLQPTWVRATIPSFMLRGFVTLTSYLQRLGITDVFEPRVADLSPMTPDLGVYVRDVQQSIGVNIRNYMKPDRTHSRNGLFERAGPVPFTVVHPFLYFIVDTETSVTLIAGRVDDPLNSRIV